MPTPQSTLLADWPHLIRRGTGAVLLALHGTGGSEQDLLPLIDALDPTATVLAPRGRVLEQGLSRWFERRGEGVFDVDSVVREADRLAAFLADALTHYELSPTAVTAVGFSNGANIALAVGMRHPGQVSRVVAFSGMYPFGSRSSDIDLSSLEAVLLNGSADAMAPASSVDRLVAALRDCGAAVERRTRPGGHGITNEEIDQAAAWLRSRQQ